MSDVMHRQRLVDLLEERWRMPVVLIEAPGGYGKSIAIEQAVQANRADPAGTDRVVVCEAGGEDAATLAGAFGDPDADPPPADASPVDLADATAAAVGYRAPMQVGLVVDDVHHLGDGGDGLDYLAALVRALPTNAHLVLAGRSIPALPLSRLFAADQVRRIGQRDLTFTRDELRDVADGGGVEFEMLLESRGWPALAQLSAATGRSADLDALLDEVAAGLDTGMRRALSTTVLAGAVDDQALAELLADQTTVADLMAAVPLVEVGVDGFLRAHALWDDRIAQLVGPDELRTLGRSVCRWHIDRANFGRALRCAASLDDWETARTAALAVVDATNATIRARSVRRWIDVFPDEEQGRPEVALLRGLAGQLTYRLDDAIGENRAALDSFLAHGDLKGAAIANRELGIIAWLTGNSSLIATSIELFDHILELAEDSPETLESLRPLMWLPHLGRAALADLRGDPEAVLASLDRIDPEDASDDVVSIVAILTYPQLILLGRSSEAVAVGERRLAEDHSPRSQMLLAALRWCDGDPDPVLRDVPEALDPDAMGPGREDLTLRAIHATIASCVGVSARRIEPEKMDIGRPRDLVSVAVIQAASLVAEGREHDAIEVMAEAVDRTDDHPVAINEYGAHIALGYVLSSRVRTLLDERELGPKTRLRRSLARLLLDVRHGRDVDWSTVPAHPEVMTALPLRWSVELVAAATADGHVWGRGMLEYLVDKLGEAPLSLLTPADAEAIVHRIPARPTETTTVSVFGSMSIAGPGDADGLRRVRARQMVGLMVLHDRVETADAIATLWPDATPTAALNNLRVTLTYVRGLLEADRSGGRPSYHVKRTRQELWLHRSPHLVADLWIVRDLLRTGEEMEGAGRVDEATAAYQSAVDRWNAPLLPDLADTTAESTVRRVERRLANAGATIAELAISTGNYDRAAVAAEHVLQRDPTLERGYAALLGAHIAAGDRARAADAVERLRVAADQGAVTVSASTSMLLKRFDWMSA